MTKLLIMLFHNWNIIPCKCGCKETRVTDQVLLDTYGPVCEYSLRCVKCNRVVNYWGYGYYEFVQTKTERIRAFPGQVKGYIVSLIWRFKNDYITSRHHH